MCKQNQSKQHAVKNQPSQQTTNMFTNKTKPTNKTSFRFKTKTNYKHLQTIPTKTTCLVARFSSNKNQRTNPTSANSETTSVHSFPGVRRLRSGALGKKRGQRLVFVKGWWPSSCYFCCYFLLKTLRFWGCFLNTMKYVSSF